MLETRRLPLLGFGAFSIFAVLAGLVLLVGVDRASPGCAGPAVERCDYIAAAKAGIARQDRAPFYPELGIEVFDLGSSVRVQQNYPRVGLIHGSSVMIDRRSCRVCEIDSYRDPTDESRGRLELSIPPEDPIAAAEMDRALEAEGIPLWSEEYPARVR
ncbi:MAG: hypothetical protein KKA16_08085 [Alphaproteobacteria bacterium]|nr:hypothetical protein [Alphaproteobacteria bacterium]MBU2378236.1 hypothetical protein [Alphaproteobacteria bacterium]